MDQNLMDKMGAYNAPENVRFVIFTFPFVAIPADKMSYRNGYILFWHKLFAKYFNLTRTKF